MPSRTASTALPPIGTTRKHSATPLTVNSSTGDELIERYLRLIEDFGLVTIEDPLQEEDFEGFAELTSASGIQIVGDDLFTTNSVRLARGIEQRAANSLLWKVNQIGTLSEAWDAATMAFHHGLTVVVSERSGETEDPIISDLVVALGAGQIKTGAPVRGERTAKYNRLLQIEEELGSSSTLRRRCLWGSQRMTVDAGEASAVPATGSELRQLALTIAEAGLEAVDPGAATRRAVTYQAESDTVTVGGVEYVLSEGAKVWVVGAGKASYPIAEALEQILGTRIAGGLVAVRDPDVVALRRIKVVATDHPLPSSRSAAAANEILAIAEGANEGDLVIACFTGGSSALASLPPAGVTAEEKRSLHRLMLSSGLPITDINTVRKAVSAFKGGRVALAAAPGTVVNLTVSDVTGSPLDAVTDPTVQDTTSAANARKIIGDNGLESSLSASIANHLQQDLATPQLPTQPQTVMLADGATAVVAMSTAAEQFGARVIKCEPEVEGEADAVGRVLAQRLVDEMSQSAERAVILLGCGGESVVTVDDPQTFSLGGPNQHAGLRAAEVLAGRNAAALFIDTDGSDGGTEFAGALVDGGTVSLAAERSVDIAAMLEARESSRACEALDVAVRTGHTGTNVNDLFVLVGQAGDAS